jgi:hypothetical protein
LREAFERQNLQARESLQRGIGEQLPFELKCRLLGREKNERCAFGIFFERGADFSEAAEGFAAAGGAEEKSRLHGLFSRKGAKAQRNFIAGRFVKDLADAVELPIAWLRFRRKFLNAGDSWPFPRRSELDVPPENFLPIG